MRLYGQRFVKKYTDQRVSIRVETRDAVLWDVDRSNQICRVKIQGSAELIIAHFPRNWKATPYWLKPGNAVRITHRRGVRGYTEVTGEGRAIPTPITGSVFPEGEGLSDGVIEGCEVTSRTPESMILEVSEGTYRIDDIVYYLTVAVSGYRVMNVPAPMTMGGYVLMGEVVGAYTLDPAPVEGKFRYDAFCVGTDGIVDYLKGAAVTANPVKPSVPGSHILLEDYILVVGGVTAIYAHDIGRQWSPRVPAQFAKVYGDEEFDWDPVNNFPETTMQITVQCQYGWNFATTPNGYNADLELVYGSGEIWSAESGWRSDEVSQNFTLSCTFKYRRDQIGVEHSPVMLLTLNSAQPIQDSLRITLLDVAGDPIY